MSQLACTWRSGAHGSWQVRDAVAAFQLGALVGSSGSGDAVYWLCGAVAVETPSTSIVDLMTVAVGRFAHWH